MKNGKVSPMILYITPENLENEQGSFRLEIPKGQTYNLSCVGGEEIERLIIMVGDNLHLQKDREKDLEDLDSSDKLV